MRALQKTTLFFLAAFALGAQTAGDPADLVKQARKLNSEGKQDEALDLYRRALEKSPNLVDAYLGAGVALDLKGNYAEARHHFAKAIELASAGAQKDQALKSMAMSYAFEKNCAEATKYEKQVFDAQMAAGENEAAAETADELARVCLESGSLDDAYRWYQTGHETALKKAGLAADEKDLWDFRWEHAQAQIAARRGHAEEAQKHVAQAKAIFDKGTLSSQARFFPYLVGYVEFYRGQYSAAIAELQKVTPSDPFITCLIAQAYEKSGNLAKAMEAYRKVMQANSHNPPNAFARPIAKGKV